MITARNFERENVNMFVPTFFKYGQHPFASSFRALVVVDDQVTNFPVINSRGFHGILDHSHDQDLDIFQRHQRQLLLRRIVFHDVAIGDEQKQFRRLLGRADFVAFRDGFPGVPQRFGCLRGSDFEGDLPNFALQIRRIGILAERHHFVDAIAELDELNLENNAPYYVVISIPARNAANFFHKGGPDDDFNAIGRPYLQRIWFDEEFVQHMDNELFLFAEVWLSDMSCSVQDDGQITNHSGGCK